MIKGILLDIDGTLVLSNDAHARAWVDAFAKYGYTITFEQVRPLIGMGGDKVIMTLQPELNADAGDGEKIKEERADIFQEKYAADLQPAPGGRDLVIALQRQGLKTLVASSAKQDELAVLLKAAKVGDLLPEATTSDDVEHSKPDPDIVQVALDKIGLMHDEVIMLGDTPYDIESANKAGVHCIAVRCGGWKDEQLTGALAIYEDPADVLDNLAGFTDR